MSKMFCFQCEQTAKGVACTGSAGVCSKSSEVANLQDALISALVDLVTSGTKQDAEVSELIEESLFKTITNVDFDAESFRKQIEKVRGKTQSGGEASAFKLGDVWVGDEDVRSLKSLILFGLKGMAAYAYHARVLGYTDPAVDAATFDALRAIGAETDTDILRGRVIAVGKANLACMEMLDRANTETFGVPVPNKVPLLVEKGPFVVVTGHDLLDLEALLQQTEGKGVNVYTHGEMLPAHGYPELRKYKHLKGNFGTAWQNQRDEFDGIPAPVVYTTNCLMRPRDSYSDRIFAAGPVDYPGIKHVGKDRDFSEVIAKAIELGGYDEDVQLTGINDGKHMVTGYSAGTILSVADKVVEGVKSGKIKHIFLVGGCDGAKSGRNYFTEFVKQIPKDSLVLTLACGKFRFNDLDIGEIGGIPRLLDVGQCNDAFGAVKVAVALAEAFECGVNDLPLSIVLSWYEQKAVAVLLSLLSLDIKDMYLGPSVPAFLSPGVTKFLVENFGITPVSTPEADMAKMLG